MFLVKYPLDRICVKSGVLCPNCQRKVESGEVAREEIPIMKTLMELEEDLKELRTGNYIKSFDFGDEVIVILKGDWDKASLDKIAKELSSRLGKSAKVLLEGEGVKKLMEQLLYPATILGINTLWLPDGSEQMVVRVPRRDRKYLRGKEEKYRRFISTILGKDIKITFE
ncbi:transcription elongation factor [Thermogladius sp. KZ2Tp1]|uniref:transcription elongation factor n=1 Tax=unclassified Thermogladius TaxID=2647734 RepID=UPI003D10220D